MNSLPPGFPILYNGSINNSQPLTASHSPTQTHPTALSLAGLSENAHYALRQLEAQPDGHHQLIALLVRHGIADGAVQLQSATGADAHYRHQVNVPPNNDVAHLTIRARLNDQAQYDINGIDVHVPSSGKSESLTLNAPPPQDTLGDQLYLPSMHNSLSSNTHLTRFTNSDLVSELILRNNPQDFSGKPLPSGVSRGTQSMVFSHEGSTGASRGASGPRRTVPDEDSYTTSAQSDASSSLPGKKGWIQDPEHPERMIKKTVLNSRKYGREQLLDPEKPEKITSQTALNKRRYNRKKLENPHKPGETISQSALNRQKYEKKRVQDPQNPWKTISLGGLHSRKLREKRKAAQQPGPANPQQSLASAEAPLS